MRIISVAKNEKLVFKEIQHGNYLTQEYALKHINNIITDL